MSSILPLFPLNLVVFPGEELNLHIFEPRYKELVNDCMSKKVNFGIPSYVNKKLELGTEMEIKSVEKLYDDGRMDIITLGLRVFKVLNYQNPKPGKLHAEGEVEFFSDDLAGDESLSMKLIDLINTLYKILKININYTLGNYNNAFFLAHKVGLTKLQEYELLKLDSEDKRQQFIIDHLSSSIPTMREMEKTKETIKMNGHFKHFDPIKF